MVRAHGLLFGPLAAVILLGGIAGLPVLVPGYNPIHQTVSEIGEVGSPGRWPFTLCLLAVAACLLVFAFTLWRWAREEGAPTLAAWLVGCTAVSAAGVGWFSFPHPLHNLFGLSELVGYQSPLALAFGLRRTPGLRGLSVFSAVMGLVVWIAIAANLSTLDRHGPILGAVWAFERPAYGLVQRALFASWSIWCAGAGLWLWRREQAAQQFGAPI